MLFSSSIFIFLFLPCVIFVYYVLLSKATTRNLFLVLASLAFYAWGEPWFVFVIIASVLVNYVFGLLVDKYREKKGKVKLIMTVMLLFNLGIIFIFKYLVFGIKNINDLFNAGISVPSIVLPLGISFFTFQAISYVIDVYRKDGDVQKNPLNVFLYKTFFPLLIAGPIVRYQTIAKQINNRHETWEDFSQGVCRFIVGLGKKILLANTLALIADKAFSMVANELSVSFAWLGAIAYTLQIFFDFSGYSDMAIGLALMFGFHFNENFNYPYIAKSISEFWRRWHISLGTWFRDYLYFPLGGSRVTTKSRLLFNLFVVWMLTGIWHGANWTFIAWGLFYFIFITLEKLIHFEQRFMNLGWLKHIYTLLLVILGWVLFRANNITEAISYIKSMLGLNGNTLFDNYTVLYFSENIYFLFFALVFSMPTAQWFNNSFLKRNNKIIVTFYPITVILLFIISVSYIVKGTYNPFIYFNF